MKKMNQKSTNCSALKSKDSLGIALIGAGIVANLHAKAVVKCSNASLAGVYDLDPARSGSLVSQYGGRNYKTIDELLGDPAVKAVHILTPIQTHVNLAITCLEAGRDVLVEKPVAKTGDELRALLNTSVKTGRFCVPGHNYIYSPQIMRMKRLLTEGAFGRLNSFWMMYNQYHSDAKIRSVGGVLQEVFVHHAYSLLYLLGRPDLVYATVGSIRQELNGCPDRVMIVANMPNGAIVNLWASFAANDKSADPWTVYYKLMGEKGVCCHSWSDALFEDNSGPGYGLINYVESFSGEVDHFVNRCIRQGEAPLSSLVDAIDCLSILDACKTSLQTGRSERVIWPKVSVDVKNKT